MSKLLQYFRKYYNADGSKIPPAPRVPAQKRTCGDEYEAARKRVKTKAVEPAKGVEDNNGNVINNA